MNFVNNDTVTPVVGDIIRSSGQNFGAVLAQADSTAHSKGLLGVWDSTPGPGGTGAIKSSDIVEVNCTGSVVPGDTLYLSAATAGKATKTSPEIQIVIGNVIAVRVVNDVYKATVYWEGVKSELSGTQTSIVDSIAELDPDEVPALDSDGTVYAATLDNIPDSTAGDGRKAVTTNEKSAVAALAAAGTFTPPTVIDGTSGLVAGNIVRWASAGVLAKAQADTAAHAANIAGIWNGSQVVPIAGFMGNVVFDGAVTVGPCYLSPTTAGTATSTAPSLSQQTVPVGCAFEDLSSGGSYAAKVSSFVTTALAPSGMRDRVVRDLLTKLGGTEDQYSILWEDWDLACNASHADIAGDNEFDGALVKPKLPLWGEWNKTANIGTKLPSCMVFSPHSFHFLDGALTIPATLSQSVWYFAHRMKIVTPHFSYTGFRTDRASGVNPGRFGWGMRSTANGGDSTKYMYTYGNDTPGETEAFTGTADELMHVFKMWAVGDGKIYFQLDDEATIGVTTGTGVTSASLMTLNYNNATLTSDWICFGALRP